LMRWYSDPCIAWVRKFGKVPMPYSDISLI